MEVCVGIDWGEAEHAVLVMAAATAETLATLTVTDSIVDLERLHGVLGDYAEAPAEVIVGTETDRGLLVSSLVAAGYGVYAVNPKAANRYRDRHSPSGAKSDPADARMLADLVRTDRHMHRPVAADTALAEAIKVVARAHQSLIWSRQRIVNQQRAMLREYYPAALAVFGADGLSGTDATAVLGVAPTPAAGRALSLSRIKAAIKRGGRQRNIDRRAGEIQAGLRAPYPQQAEVLADAYGTAVAAQAAVIAAYTAQIGELARELDTHFEQHPDADVYRSLPGLGVVLGARVLGEFGDAPNRYETAKARKNFAGTSPLTVTSGKKRVVIVRYIANDRLVDAAQQWAFCSLQVSPGCRAFYDRKIADGKAHNQALRALANRLVGILHGCLKTDTLYNEATAWPVDNTHETRRIA